jgi:hypothetical protein
MGYGRRRPPGKQIDTFAFTVKNIPIVASIRMLKTKVGENAPQTEFEIVLPNYTGDRIRGTNIEDLKVRAKAAAESDLNVTWSLWMHVSARLEDDRRGYRENGGIYLEVEIKHYAIGLYASGRSIFAQVPPQNNIYDPDKPFTPVFWSSHDTQSGWPVDESEKKDVSSMLILDTKENRAEVKASVQKMYGWFKNMLTDEVSRLCHKGARASTKEDIAKAIKYGYYGGSRAQKTK